jgi:peptidoglycan/LPS O-acetylase OafA/YrhL
LKRFYVVDALRSVLALCVAIGHAGVFPLFGPVGQPNAVLDLMARGFRSLVFGPPAVIAFFVISGFCIHYPFADSKRQCPIFRFYARRYIRIIIPVAFTVMLFKIFLPETIIIGQNSILWHSTLWSVVCEEIYYAIYPVLNRIAPRGGWPNILRLAFGLALVEIWYSFPSRDWEDVGVIATALTLFPVWLLGCYLAENVSTLKAVYSTRDIWMWRLYAWAIMWIAGVLHFHTVIHQPLSGVFVGVAYYFWLRAEISYYRDRRPWKPLVWAGQWSYSLYLIHPIIVSLFYWYDPLMVESRLGWTAVIAAILLGSYAFYLMVERPSHRLARKIPLLEAGPFGKQPAYLKTS